MRKRQVRFFSNCKIMLYETDKMDGGKEMCRKYLVLAGVLCIVAVNVGGCKSSEEETIKI